MNNSWWQEVTRHFLQGITLKQLIHMLIILIALIAFTPTEFKEWVNVRNPEILPPYWMYYVLLFCVSYVLNGFIAFANRKLEIYISQYRDGARSKKQRLRVASVISNLTEEQKMVLCMSLHEGMPMVITTQVFPHIIELIELGVLCSRHSEWKKNYLAFRINDIYWNELRLRWDPENIEIKPYI